MRYAITGATGFVGGRLADLLVRAGHTVTALVRDPGRARALADNGVRLVPGDLADHASLRAAADGADGLFHVAGWYRVGARDDTLARRINVDGTRAVLAAVRAIPVPRLVYTSTLAVNSDTRGQTVDETYRFTGRHLTVNDATKAAAHELVAAASAAGAPAITVMPGVVYGPGDTSQTGALLGRTLRRHRVVVSSGGRFCWGFVDDIANGHLLAMERGVAGEAYMLAGAQNSLAEVLGRAANLAGGPRPVIVPALTVRMIEPVARLTERFVPLPSTYSAEGLRASVATYLGNPTKATQELGWSVRTLDDGLVETLRAERSAR
ncbi:MAG TPA: NAD-dependent epimerase/dehydratase family protein [Jiangellaceae bacterium]|nr:NAD-dependent epimerase/dehydratase family protein [Jiangellaceae bacterium]